MGQTAQTAFNAADNDRGMLIGSADQIAADNYCVIGPFSDDSAGRIGIGLSSLLCDGVVVDHGIHVSRRDEKSQSRFTEFGDGGVVVPVGLT